MSIRIRKYLKIFNLLLYPIYFFAGFLRRDPKIWVFGSYHESFTDNSKYLFICVDRFGKGVRAIWISGNRKLCEELGNRGFTAYTRWSPRGMYYCLKAKYYFFSAYSKDINHWTSRGATLVNLWHGIPLKKIEHDIKHGATAKRYGKRRLLYKLLLPFFFKRPDLCLSTSRLTGEIFSRAFDIDLKRCLDLGYPRNDILFSTKPQIVDFAERYGDDMTKNLISDLSKSAYSRIYIYMPTFRDSKRDFVSEAIPDMVNLNKILRDNNALMLLKLHQNTMISKGMSGLSNILFLPQAVDVYPVLPFTDCLITDYSSVYFDYLLLNKEILFYAYDLDRYLAEDRGMYFDFMEYTPGEKIYSFESIIEHIRGVGSKDYRGKRADMLKKFYAHADGHSARRIIEYFMNLQG